MALKKKKSEQYYLMAFITMLVRLLLENSELIQIDKITINIFTCVFMAFIFFAIMTEGLHVMQWIGIIILTAVVMYSYTRMEYFFLPISLFCIIAAKQVSLRKILTWSYQIKAVFLAVHILLYIQAYFLKPDSIEFDYRFGTGIPRFSFFISHANTFAMFLLWTIVEYIYVEYKNLKIMDILVLTGFDLFLDIFSDSNSNRVTMILLAVLLIIDKLYPNREAVALRRFVKYSYPLFGLFFSAITIYYPDMTGAVRDAYEVLDTFFTGRLKLGAYAYHVAGATFIGQPIPVVETTFWQGQWFPQVLCENTYIWMLVSNGIIYIVLFSLLFYFTADKMNRMELAVCSVYIVYAIMETYGMNVILCFAPIIAAGYLLKWEKANDGKQEIDCRNLLLE